MCIQDTAYKSSEIEFWESGRRSEFQKFKKTGLIWTIELAHDIALPEIAVNSCIQSVSVSEIINPSATKA